MRVRTTKYLAFLIVILSCLYSSSVASDQLALHLANQNQLPEYTEEDKKDTNKTILFDTYIISGWGLKAHKTITFHEFVNADFPILIKSFRRFLKKHGEGLTRNFSGSILLDIEHPHHLIRLSDLSKKSLRQYIKAINMRVNMVKKVYPYAQIGLYGLFVPYQKCEKHKADINRLTSFQLGLENGILNNLDFYTVVSYLRWEPKNTDENQCIARKIKYIDKYIKEYNVNIPYRPMLSLRIYNKKSPSNGSFIIYKKPENKLFKSLVAQLQIFQKMNLKNIIIYHPHGNLKPINDSDWSQFAAVLKLNSYLN